MSARKEEGLTGSSDQALSGQSHNISSHRYSEASEEKRKALATAQAWAAMWGATLTATEGDNGRPLYIITRWSLTRAFDDLADVFRFLERVGAAR